MAQSVIENHRKPLKNLSIPNTFQFGTTFTNTPGKREGCS